MNFRRTLKAIDHGEVVAPIIRAALFDPDFKSFTVKVRGFEARPPDGWFHPSTHPLWSERRLYWYVVAPHHLALEPFDPHSVMAVTQGHFWHSFIEHVGKRAGLFQVSEPCSCGCKSAVERAFRDEETGSRGHVDGLLAEEIFEFKTMRPSKLSIFPSLGPLDMAAWYAEHYPTYYGQAQEYMRLSGYRAHRTLILSMDYPYEMREILLPFDHGFAYEVAEKYRRVRQAVADKVMPMPCCAPGSTDAKACIARLICPVASHL